MTSQAPNSNKTERNKLEDFSLVQKAKSNDQVAYKSLVNKYQPRLNYHISKIVRDDKVVEDLVQESLLKAFNNLESFDSSYAFSTWLYRIATNHSIDYLRKRKLKTLSIDEPYQTRDGEMSIEIPDIGGEADVYILQKQRKIIIVQAIESLPDKYKEIITLRHMEEKSYQEISEIMNLPLGTVKAHIFRAREMLYKFLKDRRDTF